MSRLHFPTNTTLLKLILFLLASLNIPMWAERSPTVSNEEPRLTLDDLQGFWYGSPDINQSYTISIIHNNLVLDVGCLEGLCSNDELVGDTYLFISESYIGFQDKVDLNSAADDFSNHGRFLVCKGKTFEELIGFDENYEYGRASGYLTTTVSFTEGSSENDDGEVVSLGYFKRDTLPQELYDSLVRLSENGEVNYIEKYGLDNAAKSLF